MAQAQHLPWIQTYSGKQFTPTAPKLDDIDIVDIAHALSMQCRFNGHIRRFYSVAEHAYYVSLIVPSPAALRGLLHDAGEAYLSYLPAPLKPLLPQYNAMEDVLMASVEERFGLTGDSPLVTSQVDAADKWIVFQEAKTLMIDSSPLKYWRPPPAFTPRVHIDFARCGMSPEDAKVAFLTRFHDLTRPHTTTLSIGAA